MADFDSEWNGDSSPEGSYPPQLARDLRRLEREICGDGLRQRVLSWTGSLGDGQFRATAQGAIGALRVVMSGTVAGSVRVATEGLTGCHYVLGITRTAAPDGGDMLVQRAGEIQDSGWSWVSGASVFAATDGGLIQQPQGAWARCVGVAVASDRLLVRIAVPVRLA